MSKYVHRVLQRLAAQQGDELLQHHRGYDGAACHQAAHLIEQPHDAGHVGGRAVDGELIATDVEVDVGELGLDEAQGFVMASQGLHHLVGIVEQDHLRPQTWEGVGKFPCGALVRADPGLAVGCFSHGVGP